MIKLGQKIRFIPCWGVKTNDDDETRRRKSVVGTVSHINYAHRYFTCTYTVGGRVQRESFKFDEFGGL